MFDVVVVFHQARSLASYWLVRDDRSQISTVAQEYFYFEFLLFAAVTVFIFSIRYQIMKPNHQSKYGTVPAGTRYQAGRYHTVSVHKYLSGALPTWYFMVRACVCM